MRNGIAAALVALMLAGGLVACGGDDGGKDTTTATGTGATTTTTGGGTPAAVLACIQEAGLTATSQTPDKTGVGVTDSIRVAVPPNNAIIVDFFTDPDKAAEYSSGQQAFLEAAAGGSSEVVGDTTVVGVARPGAEEELKTVEGCLGS